ncbi:GNAT family N-acetyltransferase [Streptomyces bambusae]|uniref:GNAT family N-acetyltransferase n=1 Tax=Streptomyces bambusae TaxID=1550616 RepID=UPI001CFC547A|nr:GNAT family N-acetyltransferase [Streptomyces bambusae]MCB5163454.1 GNAT family N-acetyltransferase [Streptomyces bambusae]
MTSSTHWPVADLLTSSRLALEPLRPGHAPEAFPVFDDVRLHTWTGGAPSTLAELAARYARQAAGRSPDGSQGWLNWMLRRTDDGRLAGTVQATVYRTSAGDLEASLAWVVGVEHQGLGFAREAAAAMADWLRGQGVTVLAAYVHPEHAASAAVARALGLTPTDVVEDGEVRWSSTGG